MTTIVHIYGLLDPFTGELRYIGKTKRGIHRRASEHRQAARHKKGRLTYKDQWLRTLVEQGVDAEVMLIESVPSNVWEDAERFWIAYFRFIGARLCNLTEGGELSGGIRVFSEEERAQMSQRLTGRKHSPEAIARMSASRRARQWDYKHSEEALAKISAAGKGKPKPPGFSEKVSQGLRGKAKSPEHTEKIRANAQSEEWKAKQREGMLRSYREGKRAPWGSKKKTE